MNAELTQHAEQVASLQEPTASSSRSPPISTARPVQSTSSRPTSAATCWYHITFSAKACRCISPCSFGSQQSKRVKRVSPRVNATNITEVSGPGRTFYVCDSKSGRRFLIDVAEMTAEQRRVSSPCYEDVSGLQLQEIPLTNDNGTILCYGSTPSYRLFVPQSFRHKVFSSLHNLSHPWSRATVKLVSGRFVWPGMRKNLKAWTRTSPACHRSKVSGTKRTASAFSSALLQDSATFTWTL
ncbi:unnamed protein product [Schistocephalus solidus]|uniref:Integrase zinc-binding domain-containing protein n=1 Tax=Schistocephalus solidus TaxID=70667 RepID=A0A3P7CPY3_SCHSO|nr:unnamed protein product [Schistocephalus solidus]